MGLWHKNTCFWASEDTENLLTHTEHLKKTN